MSDNQANRMGEAFIVSLIPGFIIFMVLFFLVGTTAAVVGWIVTLIVVSLYFATKEPEEKT